MITWFFYFIIYSVLGWAVETIYCSIPQGKLVERGFLNGPYCPIYGFGAVIVLATLNPYFNNIVIIFILGVLFTTILEYIASIVMEKIFHMRWWDYSNHKFNLNGRICLLNSTLFGLLCLGLIKFIHPLIQTMIEKIPTHWLNITATVILVLFILDCIFSVIAVIKLDKHLAKLRDLEEKLKDELEERFDESEAKFHQWLESKGDNIEERMDDVKTAWLEWKTAWENQKSLRKNRSVKLFTTLKKTINYQERRIIRSFPNLSHDNEKKNIFLNDLKTSLRKMTKRKEN